MSARTRNAWIVVGLLTAAVAVAVISFVFGAGGDFTGSDSRGTDQISETAPGYEPWFSPVFEPSSGEIESGLFALQAAIGGGVVGYAIGVLRTRHRRGADQSTDAQGGGG